MNYLGYRGIKPCFIKETEDYHVTLYKYKKTPELFKCLSEFYTEIQNEKLTGAEEVTSSEEIAKALDELGMKIYKQDDRVRLIKCR